SRGRSPSIKVSIEAGQDQFLLSVLVGVMLMVGLTAVQGGGIIEVSIPPPIVVPAPEPDGDHPAPCESGTVCDVAGPIYVHAPQPVRTETVAPPVEPDDAIQPTAAVGSRRFRVGGCAGAHHKHQERSSVAHVAATP
ncbi:MAG: hypothetical protein WEE66_14955, partial [Actinomycetota bacterium]